MEAEVIVALVLVQGSASCHRPSLPQSDAALQGQGRFPLPSFLPSFLTYVLEAAEAAAKANEVRKEGRR